MRPILIKANVNVAGLRSQLDAAINRLLRLKVLRVKFHVSNELNRLLNLTDKLAQKRKDQYISSELFLLAATEDSGTLGDILRKSEQPNRQ